MSEKKESRTIRFLSKTFPLRRWLDFDRIKAFTLYILLAIKKLFVPEKTKVSDNEASFSKAMKSMQLSEAALASRAKSLYRLSMLMCCLALGIFVYTFYLLLHRHYMAAGVSLIMVMLGLVMAFRYHFWYFQITERRLGCSVWDWYQQGLLGKKHEKNSP